MLEKFLHMSALFDFYGPLLTDKQNRCLQMHLLEDFSLSEISAELGISRQAVYDMLKRSEQIMQQYEDKLGLAARSIQEKKELYAILNDLMKIKQDLHDDRLNGIIERISVLTSDSKEA
ncbi:MAG TPA: YlxM family DNA-binding protein [Candidatus Megamonas gallistercoris]|nr:YlxM family DNA-binding protein [Candidatus Megamonas gallistercoris]